MRGRTLHNYLVLEADKIFQKAGFKTACESPQQLPDGGVDFVDLLVERGSYLLCVEVETTARYVLTNVGKAVQLGLPLIILVPNIKVKKAVSKRLQNAPKSMAEHRITILLLGQLEYEVMNYFPLFSAANKQWENRKTNQG